MTLPQAPPCPPWDPDLAREELLPGLFEASADLFGERPAL